MINKSFSNDNDNIITNLENNIENIFNDNTLEKSKDFRKCHTLVNTTNLEEKLKYNTPIKKSKTSKRSIYVTDFVLHNNLINNSNNFQSCKIFESLYELLNYVFKKAEFPLKKDNGGQNDFSNNNHSFQFSEADKYSSDHSNNNIKMITKFPSLKNYKRTQFIDEKIPRNINRKSPFPKSSKNVLNNIFNQNNENLTINYDTDNSFITQEIYKLKSENKIEILNKMIKNYQNLKNLKNNIQYKRYIYLPLYISYSRNIINKSINFNQQEYSNKEFQIIFDKIYENYKFKNIQNLDILTIKNFLLKFEEFIFQEINRSIITKIKNDNYKKTKLIFAKLVQIIKKRQKLRINLKRRKSIKLPEINKIYIKLEDLLISIFEKKRKNNYLQDENHEGISTIRDKINIKKKQKFLIKKGNKLNRGVILPYSYFRLIWDLLISLCAIYNIIFIPLYFLQSDYEGIFIHTADLFDMIIDGVTFLDIVLSFRTGYIDEQNNIVTDLKEIKIHYLKTWFLMDICSTFPWEVLMIGTNTRMLNLFKLPRVLRVNRLIKTTEKFNKALVRLFILIVIFFLFAHWLGCLIYAFFDFIFIYESFAVTEKSFCKISNKLGVNDFKTPCKYFYSLFTGMSVLSVQSIEIPENDTSKNAILIAAYFLGQISFSIIVGLITSSVKNFDKVDSFYINKLASINNHLDFYNIKGPIRKCINIYYNYVWKNRKDILINTESINHLSGIVKEKLLIKRYKNILNKFDFIYKTNSDDFILGQFIRVLKSKVCLPFEIVFHEGNVCEGLYFLEKGNVYFKEKSLKNKINIYKDKFKFQIPFLKSRAESSNKFINNSYNSDMVNSNYNSNTNKLNFINDDDLNKFQNLNQNYSNNLNNNEIKNKSYFDLISVMTKTCRHWSTSYTSDFSELIYIKYKNLIKILNEQDKIFNFLLNEAKLMESNYNIFNNEIIFKMISQVSHRTEKKFYRKGRLSKDEIWLDLHNKEININCEDVIQKDIDRIGHELDFLNDKM